MAQNRRDLPASELDRTRFLVEPCQTRHPPRQRVLVTTLFRTQSAEILQRRPPPHRPTYQEPAWDNGSLRRTRLRLRRRPCRIPRPRTGRLHVSRHLGFPLARRPCTGGLGYMLLPGFGMGTRTEKHGAQLKRGRLFQHGVYAVLGPGTGYRRGAGISTRLQGISLGDGVSMSDEACGLMRAGADVAEIGKEELRARFSAERLRRLISQFSHDPYFPIRSRNEFLNLFGPVQGGPSMLPQTSASTSRERRRS